MTDPRWVPNGPFYFQAFPSPPQQPSWVNAVQQNPSAEILQVIKQQDQARHQNQHSSTANLGAASMTFFQMGATPTTSGTNPPQPPPAHHNSTAQTLNPLYFMQKDNSNKVLNTDPSTSAGGYVNMEDKKTKRAEHYMKNRELKLQKQREYYRRNREERIAKQAEYYKKNRERLKKKQCEYYKRNSEIRKQKQALYYNQKREKQKEKQRKDEPIEHQPPQQIHQQLQQQHPQQLQLHPAQAHQLQQQSAMQMSLLNNGHGGYQLVIPNQET